MNSLTRLSILSMLAIMLFGASDQVLGQEVIFCESYANTGVPKNPATEFLVDSLPFRVQVLYNNGKTTIANSKVNFLVEPEESMNKKAEKTFVNVSQGRNWVVMEQLFEQPGKYAVSVFTPQNEIMAGSLITIKVKGANKPAVEKPAETPKAEKPKKVEKVEKVEKKAVAKDTEAPAVSEPVASKKTKTIDTGFNPAMKVEITEEDKKTLHYEGVKILFGNSLDKGKLTGVSDSFGKDKGRVKVMTQVLNPQPLKTEKIQADFWMKSNTGEFDELVVSEEHDANPRSYKAYFTTDLFKSGEYKVSVYTEDFVWIASSYLTVK